MINIANPIYDSVFKYLLDDERIAITILSALLKKKVVAVETRKNEYPNVNRDKISVYRIDFAATVEEDNGSKHLVFIELQKTWVSNETLRFRQYLGWQYSSVENLIPGDEKGNAIPMVTVYILGHKLGDIQEPVIYVRRNVYDYDGNVITTGVPDSFIESLTHDSIIVQIPYLKGKVNNRLEQVLSVFNQDQRTADEHILSVDESRYESDPSMNRILFRLSSAAADSRMRHVMNVEDEYFGVIKTRDITIMQKDEVLAEQGAMLKEKDAVIEILVKSMLDTGKSISDIAALTGQDEDHIRKICANTIG